MPITFTKPLDEFIQVSEYLLSGEIEPEYLTDEELAVVQMYIDMLGEKFFLEGSTLTS
jgi:hypothetical protein